jgi:hypothetical protein
MQAHEHPVGSLGGFVFFTILFRMIESFEKNSSCLLHLSCCTAGLLLYEIRPWLNAMEYN